MVKAKTEGNDQESEAQGNEPPKPLPQHRSIEIVCSVGGGVAAERNEMNVNVLNALVERLFRARSLDARCD